ncbi:MAG: cell division protein ZapA [Comamonas sp.]
MKQVEVKIMGQSYLLGCPEDGEERLRMAVDKVDSAMCAIRDHGKIKARDRIAVLAALNLAFDLTDRQQQELAATAAGHAPLSAPLPPTAAPAAIAPPHPATTPNPAEADPMPQLELLLTKLDQALG